MMIMMTMVMTWTMMIDDNGWTRAQDLHHSTQLHRPAFREQCIGGDCRQNKPVQWCSLSSWELYFIQRWPVDPALENFIKVRTLQLLAALDSTHLLQNTVHLLILSSTAAYLLVGLYSVTYRFVPASLVRGTVRHLLAWSRGKFLSRRPPVPPSWESKIIRILMRSHRQPNSSVWKPVSVPLCVFTSVWEAFQFEHNGSKSVIVRFL